MRNDPLKIGLTPPDRDPRVPGRKSMRAGSFNA